MNLSDLTVLIKLLKAEGIKEYRDDRVYLAFHPGDGAGAEGRAVPAREAHPAPEAQTASSAEAEVPEVALPDAVRKLNPNYLKLTAVVKR